MSRIRTGSEPLDDALGGGLPTGLTLLVEAPQGVGSTEFALAFLRVVSAKKGTKAIFASALRSSQRARKEANDLLGEQATAGIEFAAIRPNQAQNDCFDIMGGLREGDILVLESTAALARAEHGRDLVGLIGLLGNVAHENGPILLLLHTQGTLPTLVESAIQEVADGVFTFGWRDGGPTKRRSLFITKLRGLAPALDGEQIPVFEATLHHGIGFSVSRVKSVV